MASAGVPGLAVAFATAGGLLVYAGFKNLSPVGALKAVSTGRPAPVTSTGTGLKTVEGLGSAPTGAGAGVVSGAAGVGVLAAAMKYKNDKYSQARRTETGWSDCSSFCDKVLTDIGVPPPTKWAATGNYLVSPQWRTVPLAQALPGDVAVTSAHMVLVTGAGGKTAIGQQNTEDNVQTGSVQSLMGSNFVIKHYVGKLGTLTANKLAMGIR